MFICKFKTSYEVCGQYMTSKAPVQDSDPGTPLIGMHQHNSQNQFQVSSAFIQTEKNH